MDARARGILLGFAMLLAFLGFTQPWNSGPASKANAGTTVVKALGNAADQAAPALNAAAADNSLACTLRTNADIMTVTGLQALPTHSAVNNGQTCIWIGTNDTVSADILAQVPVGNLVALDQAYQKQLAFSRDWARKSPTLGETVSPFSGLDAYMITNTATPEVAVVTVRPDLGLVIRYSTSKDSLSNRETLTAWAA